MVDPPSALADAVLITESNCAEDSEPLPSPEAERGAVCKPSASSPAVAEPEPWAVLRFEYRTELFDEPAPEPDAVLINVVTIEVVELPSPEPLASRGAVCRPFEDSEPFPEALAVLTGVLNDEELSEPSPEPVAKRGAVCNPIASSPAVAEPEP